MHDTATTPPDHAQLFQLASGQHGYFTAGQALACGFTWDLLSYHARGGRFIRIRRGLYRFRDYPSSRREDVVAAWLALGKDVAIVSHESALDIFGLSDVIPSSINLTIPRCKRYLSPLPGTTVHTTSRPLQPSDAMVREGMRLTSPTRTILDAAEAGTGPEQIEMAVAQALARGLTTESRLELGVRDRSRRVADLVLGALDRTTP